MTAQLIEHYVREALDDQEPRAAVIAVSVDIPDDTIEPYTMYVAVGFTLAGDPYEKVYNASVDYQRLTS